jgi:hypothetical protein
MNFATTLMTSHNTAGLKVLLDRSLVLGTVDRPQLHDIVLEYATAQYTANEIVLCQRKFVNILLARRPANNVGWDMRDSANNSVSYVCNEVAFHIRESLHGTGLICEQQLSLEECCW